MVNAFDDVSVLLLLSLERNRKNAFAKKHWVLSALSPAPQLLISWVGIDKWLRWQDPCGGEGCREGEGWLVCAIINYHYDENYYICHNYYNLITCVHMYIAIIMSSFWWSVVFCCCCDGSSSCFCYSRLYSIAQLYDAFVLAQRLQPSQFHHPVKKMIRMVLMVRW